MQELKNQVEKLEKKVESNYNGIMENKNGIVRNEKDILFLKDDRNEIKKTMQENTKAIKDLTDGFHAMALSNKEFSNTIVNAVEKIELRLSYEEKETEGRKEFKGFMFKSAVGNMINGILKVLGTLFLIGLIYLMSKGGV